MILKKDQQPQSQDALFDTAHLRADLNKRAGRGARLVLTFAVAKFAFQLITTAMLARLISPAEHGVVAMALPAIIIATSVSEFGLVEAVIQKEKMTQSVASALFWINACIGFAFAVLITLLAGPAAQYYGDDRVGPVFLALAPTVFFAALGAQYVAILRRQMRVREAETVTFVATVGAGITAVGLALGGFSYWAIAAQILVQPVFAFGLLVNRTRWRPVRPGSAGFAEARGSLRFGGVLALSRLISLMTQNLGMFIVGRAFGTADAGLYYRAWTLANLPQQRAVSPLSSVFFPALSRATQDPRLFADVVMRAATRISLLTVPIGVLICTASDEIVLILLGADWTGASPILAWFGILTLQAGLNHVMQWSLLAVGRPATILRYRIFAAGAVIVALLIGLQFGLVGMVQAYMITMIIVMLPSLAWLVVKHTPLQGQQLVRLFLQDGLFALAAIAAVLGFQSLWGIAPPIVGFLLSLAVVLSCLVVRVCLSRELRQDCKSWAANLRNR